MNRRLHRVPSRLTPLEAMNDYAPVGFYEVNDVADADVRQKIRVYIEERFIVTFDDDFTEDLDLFREGVMDSFGYIQLLRYLEKEFGVKFTETDLLHGAFVSLTQIQAHVERRMEVHAGGGKA